MCAVEEVGAGFESTLVVVDPGLNGSDAPARLMRSRAVVVGVALVVGVGRAALG